MADWPTVIGSVATAALGSGGALGVALSARGRRKDKSEPEAPESVALPSGRVVDTSGMAPTLASTLSEITSRSIEQGRIIERQSGRLDDQADRIDRLEERSREQDVEISRLTHLVDVWRSWADDLVARWHVVRQSETPPDLPPDT